MKHILFLLVSGLSLLAFGSNQDCSVIRAHAGEFQYTRHFYEPNICYVGAHPTNAYQTMVYRDYLFSNDGLFMVFNSYNGGNNSQGTGARVFYFFPRTQMPSIEIQTTQVLIHTANSELTFGINNLTGKLDFVSQGIVSEDPAVNPKNNGGVELQLKKGLTLDVGFAQGQDPSSIRTNSSTFIDHLGNKCSVINKSIFNYTPDGDVQFLMTDLEVKTFIKSNCKNLQLDF